MLIPWLVLLGIHTGNLLEQENSKTRLRPFCKFVATTTKLKRIFTNVVIIDEITICFVANIIEDGVQLINIGMWVTVSNLMYD